MPFDDYLGDLVQLLAPLRWGYALCLLSIQPEPQGRGFELSFEIRDGLDRNADRSRDLLKIRVLVWSDVRATRVFLDRWLRIDTLLDFPLKRINTGLVIVSGRCFGSHL